MAKNVGNLAILSENANPSHQKIVAVAHIFGTHVLCCGIYICFIYLFIFNTKKKTEKEKSNWYNYTQNPN